MKKSANKRMFARNLSASVLIPILHNKTNKCYHKMHIKELDTQNKILNIILNHSTLLENVAEVC